MKFVGTVLKIVAALAAVAGAVYVAATYGDKIVAWAKNLLNRCCCCCGDDCCCDEDDCCCEDDDCCCGDCCCEETSVEEAPAEDTVQAEAADFEAE